MDLNDLTQKSQEALNDAQTIALRYQVRGASRWHTALAHRLQQAGAW